MRHAREANRLDHKIRTTGDRANGMLSRRRGDRPAPRADRQRVRADRRDRVVPREAGDVVSQTNASMPNVAPMPCTSRVNSSPGSRPRSGASASSIQPTRSPRLIGRSGGPSPPGRATGATRHAVRLVLEDPPPVVAEHEVEAVDRILRRAVAEHRRRVDVGIRGDQQGARRREVAVRRGAAHRARRRLRRPPLSAARPERGARGLRRSAPRVSGPSG